MYNTTIYDRWAPILLKQMVYFCPGYDSISGGTANGLISMHKLKTYFLPFMEYINNEMHKLFTYIINYALLNDYQKTKYRLDYLFSCGILFIIMIKSEIHTPGVSV